MSFKKFNLTEEMINATKELGFRNPTKIQDKVIPLALKKRKVIGKSQTGTGKTHSFLIPIFENINVSDNTTQALIISPTRELAEQIYKRAIELRDLYNKDITIKRFIGGQDKSRNIEGLKTQPQIVIGTPGRLKDLFVNESALRLDLVDYVVIDEADMSLESGFIVDIDQMIGRMKEDVQIMVFSATIPEKLIPFLKKYLEDVTVIEIDPEDITASTINHYLIRTRNKTKEEALLDLLEIINPYLALIFSNTKVKTDEIWGLLNNKGYKAGRIHGDLTSRDRKKFIREMTNMKYVYIAASDIASRGIDIEGVSHVISMDIPKEIEFYIHRSGRTGRNNLEGNSYIIYDKNDIEHLSRLDSLGIDFNHIEVKDGEIRELDNVFSRKKRPKRENEVQKEAKLKVKKSKKVKPGYKKKYKKNVEREARKIRRKKRK